MQRRPPGLARRDRLIVYRQPPRLYHPPRLELLVEYPENICPLRCKSLLLFLRCPYRLQQGEIMMITKTHNIYHMPCGDLCESTTCLAQADSEPSYQVTAQHKHAAIL